MVLKRECLVVLHVVALEVSYICVPVERWFYEHYIEMYAFEWIRTLG